MKKLILLSIVIISILSYWFYLLVNYTFLNRILQAEQKITNIENWVIRLEKWQKEILSKLSELQIKMLEFEETLSQIKDQNKYTQYLIERNGLDLKYFSKSITEIDYYNQLLKLKTKYTTNTTKL